MPLNNVAATKVPRSGATIGKDKARCSAEANDPRAADRNDRHTGALLNLDSD